MAAVLLLGIFLGLERYQKHQDKKKARIAAEQTHATREAYFSGSKAAEAEAARRRQLERRNSNSSQSSLASWEGEAVRDGPPRYEDVIPTARITTGESYGGGESSRPMESQLSRSQTGDSSDAKGKGKRKKLWKKIKGEL